MRPTTDKHFFRGVNKNGLAVFLLVLALGWPATVALRAATDYSTKSINELRAQQQQLQDLVNQKKAAAASQKTVAQSAKDEIAKLDSDIADLQKAITKTTSNIQATSETIDQLNSDISNKEAEIAKKVEQVRDAIRQYYKIEVSREDMGYMGLLFSNEGVSKQVQTKQSYASVKQEIQRRQTALEQARAQLSDQKMQQEAKKTTLLDYQQQQQIQQKELATQESRQAALKKNAEQAYAQLTKEAQAALAEENRIEATITAKIQAQIKTRSGLSAVARAASGTPVTKGTVIGLRGSTGFSTGPHVHFGVYTPEGATVNPRTRLGSVYIWPVSNYTVSQEYGAANWKNSMYTFHNGIDLAGPAGDPVYAAADGRIIIDEAYGAYGCAVVIEHNDGWLTLYGHMICK